MFRCDIVGAGPLQRVLADQITRSGLDDIVVLNGPMPQHEVQRVVQRAAVFAAPCVVAEDGNRDGLPTVLLEAMALGTPCVATDVTGMPEAVRHGDTGLIVDQHDPPALAHALGSPPRRPDAARVPRTRSPRPRRGRVRRAAPGPAAARRVRRRWDGLDAAGGRLMRIAYVSADPGVPVYGRKGASIHVQEVIRALLARGIDVELLAARTGGPAPSRAPARARPPAAGAAAGPFQRAA